MALEVAKGAVVGHDLKPIAQRLKAAARTMASVLAATDELCQQRSAVIVVEQRNRVSKRLLAAIRRLKQECRKQVLLLARCLEQPHRWPDRVFSGELKASGGSLSRSLARA